MKVFSKVYFAGELFSAKHLIGNAVLADSIWYYSNGRYKCELPQNFDASASPKQIRDQCINTLLSCDIGVFNYDGPELDSGTVVEYLFAKFADIPAVILRTDFRKGGDQKEDAWNLMTSFFPRTEILMINAMDLYKELLEMNGPSIGLLKQSAASAHQMIHRLAGEVVEAMDRVAQKPRIMPKKMQNTIDRWLEMFCNLDPSPTKDPVTYPEVDKVIRDTNWIVSQ